MLGVLINVITVIIGSSIGLLFKKGIPQQVSHAAMVGLGACTLYIGISGSLSGENTLILIASVVLGGLVLLAGLVSPVMSTGAINEMTCAGSILIIMIGTNLMGMTRIKVADYLPTILFAPILYNLIP